MDGGGVSVDPEAYRYAYIQTHRQTTQVEPGREISGSVSQRRDNAALVFRSFGS